MQSRKVLKLSSQLLKRIRVAVQQLGQLFVFLEVFVVVVDYDGIVAVEPPHPNCFLLDLLFLSFLRNSLNLQLKELAQQFAFGFVLEQLNKSIITVSLRSFAFLFISFISCALYSFSSLAFSFSFIFNNFLWYSDLSMTFLTIYS